MTTETRTNDFDTLLAAGSAIATQNLRSLGGCAAPFAIVPEKYTVSSLEWLLGNPTRKRAKVVVSNSDGFCVYMARHGLAISPTIYADVDTINGRLTVVGVIDDHAEGLPGWREHTCTWASIPSVEWQRWTSKNAAPMTQGAFAAWLEDNLADVASVDGMPTGGDMLQMALGFERTSEKRLKSKINLQSGGLRFEYVDDEDKDTRTSMEVFSRFAIGIPVFDGSTSAYRIDARLRYRDNSGKLSFWYELVRPDRAFRQAVAEELSEIAKKTALSIINGRPWA